MFLDGDAGFSLLQYLKPNGKDTVSFKLVCSHFKEMVEKVIPLHHIIFIFQCILNNDQNIPSLVLPSHFILDKSNFDKYFEKMEKKLQQEHFACHLITKFILLFHNHPICMQFFQLPHNSTFLFQLAKENYFPESPTFQNLRTISHLLHIIQQSDTLPYYGSYSAPLYFVNKNWVQEKGWKEYGKLYIGTS